MKSWDKFVQNLVGFFSQGILDKYIACILELIMFYALFYYVFKVLKSNKATKFIIANVFCIIFGGFTFAMAEFESQLLVIIVLMYALMIFTMFNTEIKRMLFHHHGKRRRGDHIDISGVELIIEEIVRAVQNMSKKDIGALIVLSNDNLPEGIIESGTVVNAQITSQMIEAVFYPKAPLHDGAMIVEGNKIYAAGCFLPLAQNDNLPKEMGSRHRAALGVTNAANVTALVVSEETGIISIVKNGAIKKKYASASDIKNALSEYYWSDLTAESK